MKRSFSPKSGECGVAKDAVLVSDGRDAYGAFPHAENIQVPIITITSRGEHVNDMRTQPDGLAPAEPSTRGWRALRRGSGMK